MTRRNFDDRTIIPGVFADAWEHNGDKGHSIGSNPRLNVNVMNQSLSQFGELVTAARTPIIELNSSYGVSAIRDVVTATGGGLATDGSGEIVLASSATPTSSVRVKSAESGAYIAGYGAEIGIGVRFPTAPTGNQSALWGGLTNLEQDSFRFGYDVGGVFISRLRGGVEETKVYQQNWNEDKVDGLGKSGYTLDMTEGNIFQILFTWYGYGQIRWGLVAIVDNQQKFIPVHNEKVLNKSSIESPNMQVFASVDNGGDASDFTGYLGGRQYSVIGEYTPNIRYTSAFRSGTSTSTTRIPLITFKGKAAFLDRRVLLDEISMGVQTADLIAEFVLGGTLTGSAFVNPLGHTAAETALEVDTSATAITGGHLLFADYFSAGESNKALLDSSTKSLPVSIENNISLCVRTTTGTGTVNAFLRMKEEW